MDYGLDIRVDIKQSSLSKLRRNMSSKQPVVNKLLKDCMKHIEKELQRKQKLMLDSLSKKALAVQRNSITDIIKQRSPDGVYYSLHIDKNKNRAFVGQNKWYTKYLLYGNDNGKSRDGLIHPVKKKYMHYEYLGIEYFRKDVSPAEPRDYLKLSNSVFKPQIDQICKKTLTK